MAFDNAPITNAYASNGSFLFGSEENINTGNAPSGVAGVKSGEATTSGPEVYIPPPQPQAGAQTRSPQVSDNSTVTETSGSSSSNSNSYQEGQQTTNQSDITSTNTSINTEVANSEQVQNTTDVALAAIDQLIQQAMLGGSAQMQQQGVALQQLLTDLGWRRYDLMNNPYDVRGQQQVLQQELANDILPQISGAQEAAGQGQTALGAILTQNAAIQTAMAQNLVELEARKATQEQLNNIDQLILTAVAAPDQDMNTLLQALETAKGVISEATGLTDTTSMTTSTERTITEILQQEEVEKEETTNTETESTTVYTPPQQEETTTNDNGATWHYDTPTIQEQLAAQQALAEQFPNGPPDWLTYQFSPPGALEAAEEAYDRLSAIAAGTYKQRHYSPPH